MPCAKRIHSLGSLLKSLVGFGYEVDAIALGTESELYSAFHRLFSALGPSGKFELLKRIFPVLKPLVSSFPYVFHLSELVPYWLCRNAMIY